MLIRVAFLAALLTNSLAARGVLPLPLDSSPSPARLVLPVDSGWQTRAGTAEIALRQGSVLRLRSHSRVRLIAPDSPQPQIVLERGRFRLERPATRAAARMTVLLHNALVTVPSRGVYEFDADAARLTVLDGAAVVIRDGSRVEVKRGESATIGERIRVDGAAAVRVVF